MSISPNTPCLPVEASAPGKTILHGEHSVVYGKFAIAASLDLRTTVKIEQGQAETITFQFRNIDFVQSYPIKDIQTGLFDNLSNHSVKFLYNWENPEDLNVEESIKVIDSYVKSYSHTTKCELTIEEQATLNAILFLYTSVLQTFKINCEPVLMSVSTNLVISAGLGSSASLLVATTAALWKYCNPNEKKTLDTSRKDFISRWAYMAEKIFHGTPSGLDNTVCTFGSMIGFTKGGEMKELKHPSNFRVLLINTKVPKVTKVQVQKLQKLRESYPDVMNPMLDSMHAIAIQAKDILEQLHLMDSNSHEFVETYHKLEQIVDINQSILKGLGQSHKSIDLICSLMAEFNLHTKLTGAGGGGYCFTLIPPTLPESTIQEVIEKLESFGFDAEDVVLGCQGVLIH